MEHVLLQDLVQKLDNVRSGQPTDETLRKIQGALDQFAAIWDAECLTWYVRNPWSGDYGLAHLIGVTKREFMWDSPESARAFPKIDAFRADSAIWKSHYWFFSDARNAEELSGKEANSFVNREKIRSTSALYAFPQGLSPIEMCNSILFINWRTPQQKDLWKAHAIWIRLFAHSLHGAVEKLLHDSVPNVELLGRHMALAKKLSRNLPRIVAGGAGEMAGWLAELGGPRTACAIYAVDTAQSPISLRPIAWSHGTTNIVAPSPISAPLSHNIMRISVKAAVLNKVIYVDDFNDPNWKKRYVRPALGVASELAIPIVVERNMGGTVKSSVEYVVSLYRTKAHGFNYEEIGLIRGSAAHIQTVLARADDAVDAVCHDARNLAQYLYEQKMILEAHAIGAASGTREDMLAIAIVMAWAVANCELIPASLCGFPRTARPGSQEPLENVALWVERAQGLLDPEVVIYTSITPGSTTTSASIFGQMLWNLVHNASKFANKDNPEIWVNTRTVGGNLVLVVEDNGRGFGSLKKDEIAEFFLPKKASGAGHGQGYGLFIVNTCARSLGGSVSARNRGGGKTGARFEVVIPN